MSKQGLIKSSNTDISDNTFMTLEELKNNRKLSTPDSFPIINNNDLFVELLTDKLNQLNSFVKLNPSQEQIYVNLTYLKSEGYNVELL